MKAPKPEILAPAGDRDCFFAALAAGADAIYLGPKNFSARMEAENFSLAELARLVALAHDSNCRVYVAMNNMLRQSELVHVYRLVKRLVAHAHPDGLIIQDLAMLDIARQAAFDGFLALSTLANVSSQAGLQTAARLGANRVIIPRELSIDEMKIMGNSCPPELELECFVQGALCYCVSGRCWWSSSLGGKSGLRGRCVQPCRRLYSRQRRGREEKKGGRGPGERLFSCGDLELLPVARQLLAVPNLVSWKIEGRKKGPHYVYHTVTAYRLIRDYGEDAQQRKLAQQILAMAPGRPGGRARFLSQRPQQPMTPQGQTASGLLAGKTAILQDGSCVLKTHIELKPRDFLRIGTEDEKWHSTMRIGRRIPKSSTVPLKLDAHKTPRAGTPVFLIDRREPELAALLAEWQARFEQTGGVAIEDVTAVPVFSAGASRLKIENMTVLGQLPKGRFKPAIPGAAAIGLWLTSRNAAISHTLYERVYFWLPPAIFPDGEAAIKALVTRLWHSGARQFVCNAPWQRSLFPDQLPENARLIAGPFCNLANSLAIAEAASLGFCAAFVSPELAADDFLPLPKISPLPLGAILGGYWPVGMSRFGLAGIEAGERFTSPKGEDFWTRDRFGLSWIFTAWQLDLTQKRQELEKAGYTFFAWLDEKLPPGQKQVIRPGLLNWDGRLL